MGKSLIQRLTFWKSTLRGWWLIITIILAVWGVVGNFRSDFLTPEQQARWVIRLLFPRWYWIVISFLAITIIAILEGAYRTHARKVKELNSSHQSELTEKDNAHKAKIEQKEKEHQIEQTILNENHVKLELSLINLREVEVEGLKKNFRIVFEGNAEEMRRLRESHDTQVSKLVNKISEQAEQLEKYTKHNLILEVDTKFQSQAYAHRSIGTFAPPEIVPVKYDEYNILANIRVRFENNDISPIIPKKIRVSLFKIVESGQEQEITDSKADIEILEEGSMARIKLDEIQILGRRLTPFYWLYCRIKVETKHINELNQNYFLRVIMNAMGQPPYPVDLDADWEMALTSGGPVWLTPRK